MPVRFSLLHLLAFAFLIAPETVSGGGADQLVTPPTAKDLVGAWIGIDSDQLTFARFDLRSDSTRFCARVSPADTILHDQGFTFTESRNGPRVAGTLKSKRLRCRMPGVSAV